MSGSAGPLVTSLVFEKISLGPDILSVVLSGQNVRNQEVETKVSE